MIRYITRKITYGVLVLLGVVTVVFFLFNVLPGDPATLILGQHANKQAVEAIHHDLGTDKSLPEQYALYLNDLSPISVHNYKNPKSTWYLQPSKYSWTPLFTIGQRAVVLKYPYLRRSYITRKEVSEILRETLPETALLAVASMLIASVVGIFLGVLSAIHRNTFYDKLSLVMSVLGMAAPSFFVGLIIAWLFGYVLSKYTGLSTTGGMYDFDVWEGQRLMLKNLILPAVTLGMRPLAIIMQLTRSSLLEVLSQDYIRTARAKGLGFYSIVFKHALKNAMNPVITAISGWFAGLMAGAVFVERIFNWKGIGYEVFEALTKNDLPVVMGATLIFAVLFVMINILVDIAYGFLDPRVRVK